MKEFLHLNSLAVPCFDWAKDFLQSPAWNFFSSSSSGNSSIFHLPNNCPINNMSICNSSFSSNVVLEELYSGSISMAKNNVVPESSNQAKKTPRAKKGKEPILSEADVRRNLRIKKLHKGFKVSSYRGKSYHGFIATPQ